MPTTRLIVFIAAVFCALQCGRAAASPLPPTLSATLDVNEVFIGFNAKTFYGHESEAHDPQAIYRDVLEPDYLPHTADPIIRAESGPELVSADQHLDIRHHVVFAPKPVERELFGFLSRLGRPAPRTVWQQAYNDQATNVLDIPDQTLLIPGPDVERWLERMVPQLPGVARGGSTVVFINWFGKPGFRFHLYQGTGMDPDTHQDQRDGDLAGSAWGGSSGRLWFPRPRLHAAEGIDDDLDDTLSPEDHIEALQAADASPLPPVAANSAYQQAIGR